MKKKLLVIVAFILSVGGSMWYFHELNHEKEIYNNNKYNMGTYFYENGAYSAAISEFED